MVVSSVLNMHILFVIPKLALKVERYASGSKILAIFAAIWDYTAMNRTIFFLILLRDGSVYFP
jgi:hypothetical protein